MPAPYSSKTVANTFLAIAKEQGVTDLSPMKIQKLVYYAHAWYLAYMGEPLIADEIQAWKFGPVIPDVYHAFKHYGNNHITEPAPELSFIAETLFMQPKTVPPEDSDACTMILQVFNSYGKYTPIQLSNLTHSEGEPWKVISDRYPDELPMGLTIPDELIEQCFKQQLDAARATREQVQNQQHG